MNYNVSIFYLLVGFCSGIVAQEQARGQVSVAGAKQVIETSVLYKNSDLLRPLLILPSGDTVDVSSLINIDESNSYFAGSGKVQGYATSYSDRVVSYHSSRMHKEFLIVLCGEDRWKDLLVWKRADSVFTLVSIMPSEVIGEFANAMDDTLSIGYLHEDEGSVNGGYWYFVPRDTGLSLVRNDVIKGNVPFDGGSNPVKGARTMRYYLRFFDGSGRIVGDTLWYDCRNSEGDLIYARAAEGTVDLYREGYWGRDFTRVEPDSPKFRIGLSAYLGGVSYVCVEYRGRWYLTPRTQIIIDK